MMYDSERLLKLDSARLEVWAVKDEVCVAYAHCDVKDGMFLKGVFGKGASFEYACRDYIKQISGKTLVFDAGSKSRKEVTVLL